jgi:hypothetical protein
MLQAYSVGSFIVPLRFERIPQLLRQVDKIWKGPGFPGARARQCYLMDAANLAGMGTHDDNAIREKDSFVDAVSHEHNRAARRCYNPHELFL